MNSVKTHFETEAAMHQWLEAHTHAFRQGGIVYLQGDLGAGKTSFSRGLLVALGYTGRVKSPTYTLLEVYELAALTVCHFDLYRLADPEELAYLGADDYLAAETLWLVEWPSKGEGFLPAADLIVRLSIPEDASKGRNIDVTAYTKQGECLVENLRG